MTSFNTNCTVIFVIGQTASSITDLQTLIFFGYVSITFYPPLLQFNLLSTHI